DPGGLITLSHWTTPLGRNRRFATWFFAVAAPEGEVVIDDGEIRAFEWHTIDDAVGGCEAGEIMLAGPTYVSLLRLSVFTTVDEALDGVAARADELFLPRLVRRGDDTFSIYQDDPAYESGDMTAVGPRHRMEMLAAGYRYINEIDPPGRRG
ncbi:MAG: NUDIX hydrolase, partial [Actinomycetia bacterium]|nr:NUDIX hydrolase [Actinomycetes bacterium]